MQIKSIFALVFCIFISLSCTKKETETDNLFKFRDYISYTTSGRISTASNIQISLAIIPKDGKHVIPAVDEFGNEIKRTIQITN